MLVVQILVAFVVFTLADTVAPRIDRAPRVYWPSQLPASGV